MTWLLLALLAAGYLLKFNSQYSALIVIAVAAFVALDVGMYGARSRFRNLARLTLVLLVIFLVVVAPALLEIYLRRATAPYEHIHDGAIQTEEAVKFLLAGVNPYGADYASTPMALWHFAGSAHLALEHNAYLPLTFLFVLPFHLVFQSLLGWFDIRAVYLLVFVAILFLLPRLTDDWDRKLGLPIALGLNPLFVPFFIEGRNDVVILFWVILAVYFLQRGHITASTFVLGWASATKQTVWFVIPFFFAYLFFGPLAHDWRGLLRRALFPLVLTFVLFVVPFLIWDARTFIDDTLIYPSARFPIAGYGAGQVLQLFGILSSDTAEFPFFLLEILLGVPLLFWLWCYQRAHPTLRVMVGASAVFTFVVAFCNRVFQDNYIGYIIALAALAYYLPERSPDV